jgi:hypothetical protein
MGDDHNISASQVKTHAKSPQITSITRTKRAIGMQNAYVAGIIDADGTVMVKMTEDCNTRCGMDFQVQVVVRQKEWGELFESLSEWCEKHDIGYRAFDGNEAAEWAVSGRSEVEKLFNIIHPHLKIKDRQADLMVGDLIPRLDDGIETDEELLSFMEAFENFNAGKRGKRKYTYEYVRDEVIGDG